MITLPGNNPENAVTAGIASFAEQTSGQGAVSQLPLTPRPKRFRGGDKKPRRRKRAATVVDEANIAALHAVGVSKAKIGEVLDITKTAVDNILRRPDVQQFAANMRQAVRVEQLVTVQNTLANTREWLAEVVAQRDPKAFDAITRGLASLERVASSASGETNKLSATVVHDVPANISEEARALVAALLAKAKE